MAYLAFPFTQATAAPISVDIDRNVNLAIGKRNFGPVAVPDDITVCTFSVDRTRWTDPAATMSVTLEISVNNAPFLFWVGITAHGEADNTSSPLTTVTRTLPVGASRRVQGNYVVSGARFRSTLTVACQ